MTLLSRSQIQSFADASYTAAHQRTGPFQFYAACVRRSALKSLDVTHSGPCDDAEATLKYLSDRAGGLKSIMCGRRGSGFLTI